MDKIDRSTLLYSRTHTSVSCKHAKPKPSKSSGWKNQNKTETTNVLAKWLTHLKPINLTMFFIQVIFYDETIRSKWSSLPKKAHTHEDTKGIQKQWARWRSGTERETENGFFFDSNSDLVLLGNTIGVFGRFSWNFLYQDMLVCTQSQCDFVCVCGAHRRRSVVRGEKVLCWTSGCLFMVSHNQKCYGYYEFCSLLILFLSFASGEDAWAGRRELL